MELTVQKPKKIEDGKHTGKIIAVEYRTQPFEYTDLVIEFDEGMKLKVGYPTILTEESKLGKLLTRFGTTLDVGLKIDPAKVMVNRRCTFVTITEDTDRGSFSKIVPQSVTPTKQE